MKIALCLLVSSFLSLAAHAQDSAEKSRTILILDASGSMWGQIAGKAKIEIAKETGEDLIRNRPENLEMGFMTYGHRRKGDCDDIELIVPPGSETTENLLSALGKLVPKGKTPIFKSVLQAAESLKYSEMAGSVILVSDGIETCGGDLDALGKLLAEKGIDFKTHIIGFAMEDEETVALRKLADITGGTYADAGNAGELKTALASAVAMAVKPVTQLTFVPLDEDGKSLLKNGVKFSIYKDKASETPLQSSAGGQVGFEVEPGEYLATATFADRMLEAKVTAVEGKNITHNFTFTAPVLSLRAVLKQGGEPLTNSIGWRVMGLPDAEGKRKTVANSYAPQPKFRLAPGKYKIVATRGSATVGKEIDFKDKPQELELVFGAGTLKVSAASDEEGEAIGTGLAWTVYGDPDSEGNRPRIANAYNATPTFTLPAGSYFVSVSKGSATASKQMEVAAGELSEGLIVMGSGTLKTNTVMSEGQEPVTGGGLSWTVLGAPDAEGKRPKVANSYNASPTFTLPSGAYSVTVTRGSASTSVDVEISPGEVTESTLNFNAGLLKMSAIMVAGQEPITGSGLSWTVLGKPDAEGKRPKVANSYNAQPVFTLPVGDYTVYVTRGSTSKSHDVKVEAGKYNSATVELNSAILKPSTVMIAGGETYEGKGLSWTVYAQPDGEGNRPKIAHSRNTLPSFVLPIGKYAIHVRRGNASTSQEIEIIGGKLNTASLNLNAGVLRPSLYDASGKEIKVKSWKILGTEDAEGNRPEIAHFYNANPDFVLTAGSYLIQASSHTDNTASVEVEVPAGKLTDFTIKTE